MGWLLWIIVGLLAGWIAEKITSSDHGLLTNLVVGLIGSVIGGWLVTALGFHYRANAFWPSLVVATLGAVVLLFALNWFRGRST